MKLTQLGGAAEDQRRPVVVGVKLDSQSRELLTWALVKVALPSDQVIALHVLQSITSLLSLSFFDFPFQFLGFLFNFTFGVFPFSYSASSLLSLVKTFSPFTKDFAI